MLIQIADGVLIHKSEFVQSNAVVVLGASGALLIDPGVLGDELDCLANDLSGLGQSVVAGFSTHPHWDHLLWHARFGQAPRYGTARCSRAAREALTQGIDARSTASPRRCRWSFSGPSPGCRTMRVRSLGMAPACESLSTRHTPWSRGLLIEDRGVLVAGDMLSDILIPLLDFGPTADPIDDYRAALRLFDDVIGDVDVLVPGHGSVAVGDEVRHGSLRILPTWTPCVTPVTSWTLGCRPTMARIGCPAWMRRNERTSPDEANAVQRPMPFRER